MQILTSETVDGAIERGEMVYAVAISGANILRDMREAVVNTIGGRMSKYEALLDQTIARALDELAARAQRQGLRRRTGRAHRPPHHHQRRHRRDGDAAPGSGSLGGDPPRRGNCTSCA